MCLSQLLRLKATGRCEGVFTRNCGTGLKVEVMYSLDKKGHQLFSCVFLLLLVCFLSNGVSAVQAEDHFANVQVDVPPDLQKNVVIDEDTITLTLNPTESLHVPLFSKHSPTSLSFKASLLSGCSSKTQWLFKYPSGESNCSLIAEWQNKDFNMLHENTNKISGLVAEPFADTEILLDENGVNLKSEGSNAFSESISCAVNAPDRSDGYAMSLYLEYRMGSCSVQLKFDRQQYRLKMNQPSKKKIVSSSDQPSSNRKSYKASSAFWVSIFVPLGVVLILVSVAILVLIYFCCWKNRRSAAQNNREVQIEKGQPKDGAGQVEQQKNSADGVGQPVSSVKQSKKSASSGVLISENRQKKSYVSKSSEIAAKKEKTTKSVPSQPPLEHLPAYREEMDRLEQIVINPPDEITGRDRMAASIAYKYYKEIADEARRKKMGLRRSEAEKAAYKNNLPFYVTCSLRPKTQLTHDEKMDESRPVITCPHMFHSDSEGSRDKRKKNSVNQKLDSKGLVPSKAVEAKVASLKKKSTKRK